MVCIVHNEHQSAMKIRKYSQCSIIDKSAENVFIEIIRHKNTNAAWSHLFVRLNNIKFSYKQRVEQWVPGAYRYKKEGQILVKGYKVWVCKVKHGLWQICKFCCGDHCVSWIHTIFTTI